jgi:SAM-dependent methyltransferase
MMTRWYTNASKKMTLWSKILVVTILALLIVTQITNRNSRSVRYEGFGNSGELQLKHGSEVYDGFYANVYDALTYAETKNEYEMQIVKKKMKPTSRSIILDIGSGTGHHVNQFKELGVANVTGVDNSQDMVQKATELYPKNKYVKGDALNSAQFNPKSFTHISCFYFTIYYFKDKRAFFTNCYNWLMPGGRLIVHMVDNDMFDPILPPSNPLLVVSPQKYAKERITHSNVVFDEFKYNAEFTIGNGDTATFTEKFTARDSNKLFRKNKHDMYMERDEVIVAAAQKCGFIVSEKVDMVKAEYEYQYLYIFQRPE